MNGSWFKEAYKNFVMIVAATVWAAEPCKRAAIFQMCFWNCGSNISEREENRLEQHISVNI
jgi:hypothetical protein